MVQVVRVAMQLVNSGSIPGRGDHGRNTDFIKRCATALQALDPSKETELKKLTTDEQAIIRQALGGDTSTPYDGCLNQECVGKETTWRVFNVAVPAVEPFVPMSRCSRCNHPKALGRIVNSLRDIIRSTIDRIKARRYIPLLGE